LNYEVLNFGVSGYGTFEEKELLKEKGLKYKPDMVILEFVSDDMLSWTDFNKKIKYEIEDEINKICSNRSINEKRMMTVNLLVKKGVEHLNEIGKLPVDEMYKNVTNSLLELKNLSIENNFRLVVFNFDNNKLIEEIFNKYNIEFVRIDMKQYKSEEITLNPKDQHFNQLGYSIIAEELL
jgi:hypothetical protein